MKMKKVVIGAVLVLGVGLLNIASSADAYARKIRAVAPQEDGAGSVNPGKYAACNKEMYSKYGSSQGYVFIVDDCYFGRSTGH
jgi:hypothetical protein